MRRDLYDAPNANFTGEFDLMRNDADSSYNALQVQYRHRFSHGLQTLLSYTWAHSIDDASSDAWYANLAANYAPLSQERGSSDHDIRHTFSGAVSYDIPAPENGVWRTIFGNWSTDSIVYARSAPPVNVVTGLDPFPAGLETGAHGAVRPDLVPGVPLWIANPDVAGGMEINRAAFATATGAVQGDLGRNALRGFDAANSRFHQLLQAVQTLGAASISRRERMLVNIFNHPNFGPAHQRYPSSPLFGQSTRRCWGCRSEPAARPAG